MLFTSYCFGLRGISYYGSGGFKVEKDALLLTELMSPYTVEDILSSTEATVRLSDQLITIR